MRSVSIAFVAASALLACSASGGDPEPGGSGGVGGSGGSVAASGGSWPGSGGTGGASGSGAVAGSGGSEAGAGAGGGGAGGGGNCKTSCLGNECGMAMPDGCGSSIDCSACGDNTDWCSVLAPKHQNAAYNGMIDTQQNHPEYFDMADCLGPSCQVKDLAALRTSLLAFLTAKGLVAITDPNDSLEIRVRASSETTAENVRIMSSAGYSLAKYTSTCSPANF